MSGMDTTRDVDDAKDHAVPEVAIDMTPSDPKPSEHRTLSVSYPRSVSDVRSIASQAQSSVLRRDKSDLAMPTLPPLPAGPNGTSHSRGSSAIYDLAKGGLDESKTNIPHRQSTKGGIDALILQQPITDERVALLDTVDPNALEVNAIKQALQTQIGFFSKFFVSNEKPDISTYAPIRQKYRLHKKNYRTQSISATYFEEFMFRITEFKDYYRKHYHINYDFYFAFFTLSDLIINLFLSILYLAEREINISATLNGTNSVSNRSPSWAFVDRPLWIFATIVVLSCFTLISRVVRLFLAHDFWATLFSLPCIIDMITSLPFFILARFDIGPIIYVPYFIRSILIVSQLDNIMRLRRRSVSNYFEKLLLLGLMLFTIVYFGICSFEFFENSTSQERSSKQTLQNGPLNLMQILYFVIITIATVGYGDITPSTIAGQVVVIIMILVSLVSIPALVTDVQEKLRLQKSGGGSYSPGSEPFVVICGVFYNPQKIQDVINTFYNKLESNIKIVFLCRNKPPQGVHMVVSNSINKSRVTLLHGSGLGETDLDRIQLRQASAAFIMADTGASDPDIEDEHNTMRSLAFDEHAPHVPLYVDNILPRSAISQEKITTAVVCLMDMLQTFHGFNCVYRGVGTLIVNLLQHSENYEDYGDPWRAQYADGMNNHFLEIPLMPMFVGMHFAQLALYLYEEFQVTLFGVLTTVESRGIQHILLNPGPFYVLKETDTCLIITPSYEDVLAIQTLTKSQFSRTLVHSQIVEHPQKVMKPGKNDLPGKVGDGDISFKEAKLKTYIKGYPRLSWSDKNLPQCYLRPKPATYEEMVIQDASHITGHILFCGFYYVMFRAVCTMRSTSVTVNEYKTIVLLIASPPTERDVMQFACFPDVYIIHGDPRNKLALEQANIAFADKVVIGRAKRTSLSNNTEPDGSLDQFSDSTGIMVANLIYDMFHRVGIRKYVVYTLGRKTNIRFLRPTGRKRSPKRARRRLMPGEKRATLSNTSWEENHFLAPVYAGGRVIAPSMIEPVLFKAFRTPCTIDLFNALCGVRYESDFEIERELGTSSGGICYIVPPSGMIGKPYIVLYKHLVSQSHVIPVGLLRQNVDAKLGNKIPFVITNPPPSLLIIPEDLVYVISTASTFSN